MATDDGAPTDEGPMAGLFDDMVFEILALLPTFEDRWDASLVNKQWRAAYRHLARPHHDTKASEHLCLPGITLPDESRGPRCITWRGDVFMPPMSVLFAYQGVSLVQQFALLAPHHLQLYNGRLSCDVYWCAPDGQWKAELSFPLPSDVDIEGQQHRRLDPIELFIDYAGGDVFDQGARASKVLARTVGWTKACFNPVLARRLWSFPHFVRIRESILTYRGITLAAARGS